MSGTHTISRLMSHTSHPPPHFWPQFCTLALDSDFTLCLSIMKKALLSFCLALSLNAWAQVPVHSDAGFWLIDEYRDTLNRDPYEYIHPLGKEYYLAIDRGDFFYINESGRRLADLHFQLAYPFKDSFALVYHEHKYQYLSDKGQFYPAPDWPKEPSLFGELIVIGEGPYLLQNADGDTVLLSEDPLFTTTKSGLYAWNKNEKRVHQYIGKNKRDFRLAHTFEAVDTLAFNHQGYAFIESDGEFSVYDNKGRLLFEKQAKPSYYLSNFILWNRYLYLNRPGHLLKHYETEISSEPLINSSECILPGGEPNKFGAAVYLAQSMEEEEVALLQGSEKWALYDAYDRTIEGDYLFDKVLPSDDDDYLLVRQNRQWSLLDVNNSLLHPLAYRYIHPIGYREGYFFGSDSPSEFADKTWRFHHWEDSIISAEHFKFTQSSLDHRLSHPLVYNKINFPEMLSLIKGDSLVIINAKGKSIAGRLVKEEAPYTIEEYFRTKIAMHKKDLQALESRRGYDRKSLKPYLEIVDGKLIASLVNTNKDSVSVYHESGYLIASLEYQVRQGEWISISDLDLDIYNDYDDYFQMPGRSKISYTFNIPEGYSNIKVRLKAELKAGEYSYSNVVSYNFPAAYLRGAPFFPDYGARSKFDYEMKKG